MNTEKIYRSEENHKVCMTAYIIDDIERVPYKKKPCVLVLPGGGYHNLSARESDPIAFRFLAAGYHAFILQYSIDEEAGFPDSLEDVLWAMRFIRENCEKYSIDPDKIVVCGFSAGGHLAGSLGVFWRRLKEIGVSEFEAEDVKPNAIILGYPVIVSEKCTHFNSMRYLLKEKIDDPVMLKLVSLDKQVTGDVPPCFLWHTADDELVPVENSLAFAKALSKYHVPFELHIYEHGPHGMSVSLRYTAYNEDMINDNDAQWIEAAIKWVNHRFNN